MDVYAVYQRPGTDNVDAQLREMLDIHPRRPAIVGMDWNEDIRTPEAARSLKAAGFEAVLSGRHRRGRHDIEGSRR